VVEKKWSNPLAKIAKPQTYLILNLSPNRSNRSY